MVLLPWAFFNSFFGTGSVMPFFAKAFILKVPGAQSRSLAEFQFQPPCSLMLALSGTQPLGNLSYHFNGGSQHSALCFFLV